MKPSGHDQKPQQNPDATHSDLIFGIKKTEASWKINENQNIIDVRNCCCLFFAQLNLSYPFSRR